MAWTKVVIEDSSGHVAQTAAKADHLSTTTDNGPELVYQTDSGTTSYIDKGTSYQVLQMASNAASIGWVSTMVETRDIDQDIAGEKYFTDRFGPKAPADAAAGGAGTANKDTGHLTYHYKYWNGSASTDIKVQEQVRSIADNVNPEQWEWVIGPMNSGNNAETDMVLSVDYTGSVMAKKNLYLTGGIIGDANKVTAMTVGADFDSSDPGSLKIEDKLAVMGNVIQGTGGATMTMNGTKDVTFANDVTVTGDLLVSGDTVTVNAATLSIEDKIIELANGATNAATASLSGINVNTTNSTQDPTLLWTNAAILTGWGVKPEGEDATYALAVQTQSTSAGAGNSAGVGTFHYDTSGQDLYIRTS